MAREGDEGSSFDPKTWGKTPPPAPAPTPSSFDPKTWSGGAPPAPPPGPSATSFDPKTWTEGTTTTPPRPATVPPRPATAPPGTATASPRTLTVPPTAAAIPTAARTRMPLFAAYGASALLLVAGGGAALFSPAHRKPVEQAAAGRLVVSAPTPADPVNPSRRTLVVAGAADIAAALASNGVAGEVAAGAAGEAARTLGKTPGDIRMVIDLIGPDNARHLTRLEATRDDGSGIVLTARADGSYGSEVRQAALTTEVRVVRGEMDATSFYSAAVTAGVTDSLVSDIAKAFSYDFNFATDVHAGDIFEAAFEQKMNPAGETVGPPTLIYVSLQTSAKSKSLYRFLAPGETEPGWYDGNGRSTVTALMRTPVDGARITSGFGMRFHPVLHYTRLHGGTDFAAPIGTPIYAAAAGVVTSASPSPCAGNMVIIKHDNGWETRYFHTSRYADGIVAGVRVTQGQTVGYVGTTGFCTTGPHLHFEVHINGEKVDPMSIDTGTGKALEGDALAAFRRERDRIDVSRAAPVG